MLIPAPPGSQKMSRVPLESSRRAVSKSQGPVRSLRGSRKAIFQQGVKPLCEQHGGAFCSTVVRRSVLARCARSPFPCTEPSGILHSHAHLASACRQRTWPASRHHICPQRACSDTMLCTAGDDCRIFNEAPSPSCTHHLPRARHGARCLF